MAKVLSDGLGITLRGKAGNAVFAATKYGLVLRPRTQPTNPKTPAQIAARARLSQVSARWKTLTPPQQAAWQHYAQTVTPPLAQNGSTAPPAPHILFIALGSKFLQVHPNGILPLAPPATPFFGDGITVTASGGAGKVTFTASGPNAANVVTELLLQPLAHGGRAPKYNLYRPQAFVSFATGSLSQSVTIAPGWYAPAFRFVHALTGQESERASLPALQVV